MPTIAALPYRGPIGGLSAGSAPIGGVGLGHAPVGAAVTVQAAPFLGFGWAYLADGRFTSSAPLLIPAGTSTQITIDGLGASTDTSFLRTPFAGWSFWNNNKFWPYSVGDKYTLRLDFTATSIAINNGVRAALDIGSSAGPVFDDHEDFGVGAGVPRNFRFDIPIFAKTTFKTNGATLSLTPDSAIQIWSIGLFISPDSVGTPR